MKMGINIPLIDKWRIRSDKYNYMIVREEGGREFIEGYFSKIEEAIQSFIDMKIKGFNSTSVHSLIQSINSLQTALNKALQPLKLEVKKKNE